jgi:4-hydroxy-tetrahydrodipicolinate reductase
MKIILFGYGKMGKAIEQIAIERGHTIIGRINKANRNEAEVAFLRQGDVVIEFSNPESAVANYRLCFAAGIPVVSGTTGWIAEQTSVEQACLTANSGFFYASNFSVGVFIFSKINQLLAKLMDKQPNYDVAVAETHHTQKLDAPSGTAITLANQIIAELDRKNGWNCVDLSKNSSAILLENENNTPKSDEITIFAARIDPAPGTHSIAYRSEIDSIEITHTAHSRKGFALGAVLAAEFIQGKQGVFGMNDLMQIR